MLILLLKTRLKYYRNYIRYHFDRTTKIELGLIFLVFLLLIFRSPSDIGYNFRWMYDEAFPAKWANIFSLYLPIFYLLSEAFAIYTLRRTNEWQIIGALPFAKKSIANYFVFRFLSKMIIFIIVGFTPFWLAFSSSANLRTIRSFAALGVLLFLSLIAFIQVYHFRNRTRTFWQKWIRWLITEVVIILSIVLVMPWLRSVFSGQIHLDLIGLLAPWFTLPILLISIQKSLVLSDFEKRSLKKRRVRSKPSVSFLFKNARGFYQTFLVNDLVYLWRQRRSSFGVPILSGTIGLLICFTENDANSVCLAIIFVEALLSLFLIKTVTILFERDAEKFSLVKSLPITAFSLWWQRWFLMVAVIAIPMLIPTLFLLIKQGVSSTFLLFVFGSLIAIPSTLATIFCNSCFGLFPQVNLSGYMISITVIMLFLFWFFIPFGTLILLAVMVFWIRKSQKHVQFLEA